MRLPMTPNVSTKDGTSNKNARLTNCLKETTKRGDKAVIRPGLVTQAETTGAGGGLVVFDNNLVSVYGTTLGFWSGGTLNWTPFSVDTYTITDEILTLIRSTDGSSMYIGIEGYLYSSSNGQSFSVIGAVDTEIITNSNNGSIFFDDVNLLWYGIRGIYDVDFDDYAYYFASSGDLISWTNVSTLSDVGIGGSIDNGFGYHIFRAGAYLVMADMALGGTAYRSVDSGITWQTISGALSGIVAGMNAYTAEGIGYVFGSTVSNTVVDVTTNGSSYARTVMPFATLGFSFANGRFYFCSLDSGTVTIYSSGSISSDADDYELETSYVYTPGEEGNSQNYGLGLTTAGLVFWHINYSSPLSGDLNTEVSSAGSIDPLATIATGLYDFAQSPI